MNFYLLFYNTCRPNGNRRLFVILNATFFFCKLIAFLLLTAFKVNDVMLIAFDNLHTNDLLPKLDFWTLISNKACSWNVPQRHFLKNILSQETLSV